MSPHRVAAAVSPLVVSSTTGVAVIQMDPVQLDANSMIGVGLVIVIVGAAWRLSAQLATINTKLDNLSPLPEKVQAIDSRLANVEARIETLEEDLNNLWAAVRSDDPGTVRSPRSPFSRRGRQT